MNMCALKRLLSFIIIVMISSSTVIAKSDNYKNAKSFFDLIYLAIRKSEFEAKDTKHEVTMLMQIAQKIVATKSFDYQKRMRYFSFVKNKINTIIKSIRLLPDFNKNHYKKIQIKLAQSETSIINEGEQSTHNEKIDTPILENNAPTSADPSSPDKVSEIDGETNTPNTTAHDQPDETIPSYEIKTTPSDLSFFQRHASKFAITAGILIAGSIVFETYQRKELQNKNEENKDLKVNLSQAKGNSNRANTQLHESKIKIQNLKANLDIIIDRTNYKLQTYKYKIQNLKTDLSTTKNDLTKSKSDLTSFRATIKQKETLLKKLDSDLKTEKAKNVCPICFDPYSDKHKKTTPTDINGKIICGHIFGNNCLLKHKEYKEKAWQEVKCPKCNAPFHGTFIIYN